MNPKQKRPHQQTPQPSQKQRRKRKQRPSPRSNKPDAKKTKREEKHVERQYRNPIPDCRSPPLLEVHAWGVLPPGVVQSKCIVVMSIMLHQPCLIPYSVFTIDGVKRSACVSCPGLCGGPLSVEGEDSLGHGALCSARGDGFGWGVGLLRRGGGLDGVDAR